MPIVCNATQEPISIKIAGNWFSFKPGQSKTMSASIAKWIEMDARGSGLAVLPDLYKEGEELGEIDEADFATRKVAHDELKKSLCEIALDAYIQKYRSVIYNNQVSMRQDLEKSNIKADPAAFASKGELEAMRLVAKYQKKSEDKEQDKIDEVKKLMKTVKEGE